MLTLKQHWVEQAIKVPSPNFNARPADEEIRLIVVHCISLPPEQFGGPYIDDFFQNKLDHTVDPFFAEIKDLKVSAHFLIRRDGTLHQFVSCADRAWHAGVSSWQGHEGCNDFSIGIELEGADTVPYEPAQYQQLAKLIKLLRTNYPAIKENHIVGHSDIAPGRKTDPGPAFDWSLLQYYLAE